MARIGIFALRLKILENHKLVNCKYSVLAGFNQEFMCLMN